MGGISRAALPNSSFVVLSLLKGNKSPLMVRCRTMISSQWLELVSLCTNETMLQPSRHILKQILIVILSLFLTFHFIFLPQSTGVTCADDIASTFEDFKLQKGDFKGCTYIIYKINDSKDKIIIDAIAEVGKTYDDFVATLPENDCRYAVIDVHFETNDGRETSKLVMMSWIPDTAKIRSKMLYAGSKEALKSTLMGVGIHLNATDFSDVDFETCIKPAVLKFT